MIRAETKNEGNVTIFHLRENLNTRKVKDFTKKLNELIESGRCQIVLEMGNIEEICLMGMVAISSAFNRCRQAGGALKVAQLQPEVRRSFRETNLINTIEVFDNLLDAVKSYEGKNLLKAQRYSGSFYLNQTQSFVAWDRLPLGNYLN